MLNKCKKLYFWLAILLFLIPATALLMRDLWFDEALTVLNFALLPSPKDIYLNYAIPNNHIIYTGMLNCWLKVMPGFFPADVWLRLISFFSAWGIILLLYKRWKNFFGDTITLFCLASLITAPGFLTYSGAVRGYMAGALFTLLYLTAGLEYAASGKFKDYWPCGAFALITVGIAPSNLAALTAASFYLLFQCRMHQRRFWIIGLTPFSALIIFYAPIYQSLLKAWQLGEGWQDGPAAARVWFISVIISFLPAFLLALSGTLCAVFHRKLQFNYVRIPRCNGRQRRTVRRLRQLIWLLPLPAFLLLKVAPFPRVFLPLLPIYCLLLAELLKHISAYTKSYRKIRRYTIVFFLLAAGYGVLLNQTPVKTFFSDTFLAGSYGDDFFMPHYLRKSHTPRLTAKFLTGYTADNPDKYSGIYSSFCADPWALMFYTKLNGVTAEILFDGPQGKIDHLPQGSLIIIRRDEHPEDLEKRFQHRLKLLYLNANHKVYRCL